MKKIILYVFTVCLFFSIAACGSERQRALDNDSGTVKNNTQQNSETVVVDSTHSEKTDKNGMGRIHPRNVYHQCRYANDKVKIEFEAFLKMVD